MVNSASPNVRVYGSNPWSRLFYYGLPIGYTAFAVALIVKSYKMKHHLDPGSLLPFFGTVVFGLLAYLFAYRLRLRVSPEGIQVRTLYGTMETAWNNVVGVHRHLMEQGFVTREPMIGKAADRIAFYADWKTRGNHYYSGEIRPVMRERKFLLLAPFSWHFKHGDFVAVVQRFAPHVTFAEIVPPPGPPLSKAERLTAWVFAAALIVVPISLPKLIALGLRRSLPANRYFALGGAVAFGIVAAWTFLAAWRRFRQHRGFVGILLVLASVALLACALLSLAVGLDR